MKYLKAEPFEWTSPLGRETPPWKVPAKPKPNAMWVKVLKVCKTHMTTSEIASELLANSISLSYVLFNLYESQLLDKFYHISPKTNKPINRISYKISRKGANLIKKLGL